jgi:hypothetical protein
MEPAAIDAIRKELFEKGYHHHPVSRDFECITRELGGEIVRDSVRLHLSARLVHSPGAIPFHTDSILADYVGWHCLEPTARNGEILLIDGHDILSGFSPSELRDLARVQSGPSHPGHTIAYQRPLLGWLRGRPRLFYTPWNIVDTDNTTTMKLLNRFKRILDRCAREKAIGIRLERGESLFIDNRRILHGRSKLPADSPRHLTRVWIARGEIETELLISNG